MIETKQESKRSNRLTNYERETVINYNRDEDMAHVFTWDHRLQAQLEATPGAKVLQKGMHQHPDDHYTQFEVPKSWVKIRPPKRVSETQRAAARENMRILQNKERSKDSLESPLRPENVAVA